MGVPGMFLSVPVIAIIKVVIERIESLMPWGLLLGDEKDELPPLLSLKEEVINDEQQNIDSLDRIEQPKA